jgi:hypothetical protein
MSKAKKAKAARTIVRHIRRRAAMLRFRKERLERQRQDRMYWLLWCCCLEQDYSIYFYQRWISYIVYVRSKKIAAANTIGKYWRGHQRRKLFVTLQQKHRYLKTLFRRMANLCYVESFDCWVTFNNNMGVLEKERAAAVLQLSFRNRKKEAMEKLREQTLLNLANDHSGTRRKIVVKLFFGAWKMWYERCRHLATIMQSHWLRKQAVRKFGERKRQLLLVGQMINRGQTNSMLKCFAQWVVYRKQCILAREKEAVRSIQGIYRRMLNTRNAKEEV